MAQIKFVLSIIPIILLLSSCQPPASQPIPIQEAERQAEMDKTLITLGSKAFTEQYLLMRMTSMLLREEGFRVKEIRFLDSPSIRNAFTAGVLDAYWEYTSTAWLYYHNQLPILDDKALYEAVRREDNKIGLVWLNQSQFNSSWGVLVKQSFAEENGVETVSDLFRYMKTERRPLTFAMNDEFMIRNDGLPLIEKVYGSINQNQAISVDSELLSLAVKEGRVQVAFGMVSDSRIEEYRLKVLKDDRLAFSPYMATPVLRLKTLEAHGELRNTLNRLSSVLTNENMRQLNHHVDVQQQDLSEVAESFLKSKGLLPK